VAVIRRPVTVDRKSDFYPIFGEKLAEFLVEQDAIRVDPQIEAAHITQRAAELGDNLLQACPARQQGLATVQHDLHVRKLLGRRVVSDTPCRLPDHFAGHGHGAPAPALVGGLIDITVITSQVAAAVNLQDELAQRNRHRAHSTS